MLSAKIGHRLDPYLSRIAGVFVNRYISPNLFTFMGLITNILAGVTIFFGMWTIAGCLILFGGSFDILDGALARNSGKVSRFGELLDSVIDRYSDLILLCGLIVFYSKIGDTSLVAITCIVSIGTVLIPYTRAKAEKMIPTCNIGILERAERIILLAVGALFNLMEIILWILVVLTHFTVLQRVYFVWKEIGKQNNGGDAYQG
ncbi:MAG: CDP-alcohol phosphatidyltransferase family protein [Thermodesulfobacteriota bacterium]|nr:CDP-alcohol phosphatidyltransferase family protein [Thermodesulfobacteriota bacterium]